MTDVKLSSALPAIQLRASQQTLTAMLSLSTP
jgi:hypothetical protein